MHALIGVACLESALCRLVMADAAQSIGQRQKTDPASGGASDSCEMDAVSNSSAVIAFQWLALSRAQGGIKPHSCDWLLSKGAVDRRYPV
jgi:hypothetical protein